ncbi:hypothetical protein SAY86_013473 [Trapa natans]|uniref:Uncharacterized protein n=1 Tax=Trapa natans TaxID=22666 RepID=A0AAN7M1C0_TRANT|nr:hypothetical protein SAY86_013473 [Trapa natans]
MDPQEIMTICKKSSEENAPLGPFTPDTNGECRDRFLKDPLTLPKRSERLDSVGDISDDYESPHTPKVDVFDPFAPSSDDLLHAPQCNKPFDDSRTNAARHLSFGLSIEELKNGSCKGDGTSITDEEILELVYNNILKIILESKTEDPLPGPSIERSNEVCDTPASRPKLIGVAETCPRAPRKAAVMSRNIDLSLCKKLLF